MCILAQNPVEGGPSFSSLEPGEDIGNFLFRWDWITRTYTSGDNAGILTLWLQESPSTRLSDVEQPLLTRALQYSIVNVINTALTLY